MVSMAWPIIFVFPPPASVFITAMSAISFTLASAGISEMRGKNMQYSKFWKNSNQPDSQKSKQIYISGRRGMQIAYTPAFLASLTSLVLFPHNDGIRYLLLSSALTIHFLKRLLEVQFVHKYSGGMALDTAIPISLSYFMSTATMVYAQHLTITQGLPEPPIDLKYPGILLFLVGISGNFYHHYLLSRMRSSSSSSPSTSKSNDDKDYKIPRGGLFELVVCPHYLFEIIGFIGFAFISQTLYAFAYMAGTTFYLTGRSYATRRWYLSKFKNFPQHVKALIPYMY
uniref:very-long-chain enoyl-CoA reductase-like n=1 Tax=Fragaria vesca subsp. vesca TaxID=101020 RepID=UPI0005C9701C|nr:PREDICTED: very-long-chain enoyl-CoA reductase-like [Fragaria vesca subsp. vesca]